MLELKASIKLLVTVVNDGSTDNTADILKKYTGNPNVEIITQRNKGLSGARNMALNAVKARYVTFLDSDDEFLSGGGKIDCLIEKADKCNVDILECGYVTFNEKGNLRTMQHENLISDNANGILYGFPWGKIMKSSIFDRVQFPLNYWFEDTVMTFVIFPMCKTVVTDSTLLYHYRINPDGITHKAGKCAKVLDTFYVTESLLKDRRTLGLKNDSYFAKVMLQQIRTNHVRISGLGRSDVNRALFVLSSALWKEYFSDVEVKSPLADSLTNGDYWAYLLILEIT